MYLVEQPPKHGHKKSAEEMDYGHAYWTEVAYDTNQCMFWLLTELF